MILSVSRRTDIPSYYSEWFFNRLNEGFVYTRNPMNIHKISRIPLTKDIIDGIVFWTKNPGPMLKNISKLDDYTYYFQFTVNSYGNDVEVNIPSKKEVIVPTFQKLSLAIGKERMVWRYDPIFFNEKYTISYHTKYFEMLCSKLSNYTEKCTISFLDLYKNTQRNISELKIEVPSFDQMQEIAEHFSKIAKDYGIIIDTCAEKINLDKYGIQHAHCIDKNRLERISGYKLNIDKDKNQRFECGCFASVDIGAYNTCKNGCKYCYANFSQKTVSKNFSNHNPKSPLLFGNIGEDDEIIQKKAGSLVSNQIGFFD